VRTLFNSSALCYCIADVGASACLGKTALEHALAMCAVHGSSWNLRDSMCIQGAQDELRGGESKTYDT
jgi:hypothetical protein